MSWNSRRQLVSVPEFDDRAWNKVQLPSAGRSRTSVQAEHRVDKREDRLRRTFEMPPGQFTALALVLHHDEDTAVYINGVSAAELTGDNAGYELVDISLAVQAALKPDKHARRAMPPNTRRTIR